MFSGIYIAGYVFFLLIFVVQYEKLIEIIDSSSTNPFYLPMWFADFVAAVITALWPATLMYLLLKRFGQSKG